MAKLIVIVDGGVVQAIESDEPGEFTRHEIIVRDMDNERGGERDDSSWVVHPLGSGF